ncbi:hypothetical protein [Mycoplasma yeatsii]|nr:hypothetical protein [Mycoplasma yeatsii]AJM72082.1 hypothetical protein MYE_03170 [Mycoplasma yeatsii GM274B]
MKNIEHNSRIIPWDSIPEEDLLKRAKEVAEEVANDKEFVALLKRLEKM